MLDPLRSPTSGRELAALGRGDGTSAMPDASVTARRREADAFRGPASPARGRRERPRHGSSMDWAKVAGMEVANEGPVASFTGKDSVPKDLPPLVCLPTTCGTGSEVTFNAVITDPDAHFKLVYVTRKLAPLVALVDPALV